MFASVVSYPTQIQFTRADTAQAVVASTAVELQSHIKACAPVIFRFAPNCVRNQKPPNHAAFALNHCKYAVRIPLHEAAVAAVVNLFLDVACQGFADAIVCCKDIVAAVVSVHPHIVGAAVPLEGAIITTEFQCNHSCIIVSIPLGQIIFGRCLPATNFEYINIPPVGAVGSEVETSFKFQASISTFAAPPKLQALLYCISPVVHAGLPPPPQVEAKVIVLATSS